MTRWVSILVRVATFPLQPNQMPDFCLSAVDGDFKPTDARLRIFLGGGDPIRDYDKLRQ